MTLVAPEQCARAASDAAGGFEFHHLLPLSMLALVAVALIRSQLLRRRELRIGRDHPLLLEAAARAQASLPMMRHLQAKHGGGVAVKFALDADGEAAAGEQLWGRLLQADANCFTASVDTPPLFVEGPDAGRVTLPWSALLDWQCELPDGDIRGGFSRQAEIRICRQRRRRLPAGLSVLQGRFADD